MFANLYLIAPICLNMLSKIRQGHSQLVCTQCYGSEICFGQLRKVINGTSIN
jgi:hypothetical protein